MSLSRPLEQGGDLLRFKLAARRPGDPAVRRAAGAREHGPAGASTSSPTSSSPPPAARFWLHDFRVQPIEACELDPDQVGEDFQDAFARVWRGEAENDGFNQLVLRAGLNWRQVDGPAHLLQVSAADRDSVQPGLHGADPGPQPRARAAARRAVRGALRSRRQGRPRGAAGAARGRVPRRPRQRRQPRRGPDPAALHAADPGDPADQLLSARRATAPPHKPYLSIKIDPARGARHAAAAAGVRDLRLLAPGRGRPSARRQGRPRRHPLVGPARGFPHRGAGPDEGADGQERGHRAGRRQGRLRRQAAAPGRATGRRSRPRWCTATRP